MNEKQRSSNFEPNPGSYSANEKQLAEQTVRVLESLTHEAESKDDQATAELGRLLRDAAQVNQVDGSPDMREQLLAELDGRSMTTESTQWNSVADEVASRSTGRRRLWIAAAASGLLLVGGAITYNAGFVGSLSNVAMVEPTEVEPIESPDVAPQIPKVVFRTETATRKVPITRMRTETKARSVPITRYRSESRQVKQADGSFKTETIKVPYTENVSQSYTVQVPAQEQITQSYTVQVPYTADGKRIEKSDYGKYGLGPAGQYDDKSSTVAPLSTRFKSLMSEEFYHEESHVPSENDGIFNSAGEAIAGELVGPFSGSDDPSAGIDSLKKEQAKLNQRLVSEENSRQQVMSKLQSQIQQAQSELADKAKQFYEEQKNSQGYARKLEEANDRLAAWDSELTPTKSHNKNGRDDIAKQFAENKNAESVAVLKANGKSAVSIANERKMIEELELQRDLIIASRHYGHGHASVRAIELVIAERKARLHNLFSEEQFKTDSWALDDQMSGEQYEPIIENAFIAAQGPTAISTFSIDVDTASYANMRRLINSGQQPPPNSIRLEELVNYFQYDYAQPTGDHPFSVNLELAQCPWQDGHQLLRVGLKGEDIHVAERPATNVVFLIDVSGSMSSNDKLPLLKSGFQMMAKQLGENDRISIVTYAGNAGVALAPTNGTQTEAINSAIERLSSGGSTHGSAGIELAYELAQKNFVQGGVNKVMLATDGDLNVGVTSDDDLVTLIKEKAAEGVFLTVLGFGSGNLKDAKLEKLADNGNGMYAYIDSTREARRVLVDQLSGSLVTIAKDVKIQVEFNPAEVKSYRLLGYENRMLETKDFDDDRKDAGEIGAGHTVTAIYQIEPAKAVSPTVSLPAGMKYQVESDAKSADKKDANSGTVNQDGLSKAAMSGELATVALRYKEPDSSESERLEVSIKNEPKSFKEASADFRFAASVAGFGMYLRNSKHRGTISTPLLQRIASESIDDDKTGVRSEFIDLIRKAP